MTHYLSFTNLLVASLALALIAAFAGDVTWIMIFAGCAVVCSLMAKGGD